MGPSSYRFLGNQVAGEWALGMGVDGRGHGAWAWAWEMVKAGNYLCGFTTLYSYGMTGSFGQAGGVERSFAFHVFFRVSLMLRIPPPPPPLLLVFLLLFFAISQSASKSASQVSQSTFAPTTDHSRYQQTEQNRRTCSLFPTFDRARKKCKKKDAREKQKKKKKDRRNTNTRCEMPNISQMHSSKILNFFFHSSFLYKESRRWLGSFKVQGGAHAAS
ncbi:hypothetical protein F5Y14DRAFT_352860 [Nemania sp. NC0429]|nr:hypothetical protein F5Y14DRAFT_352860 [Nemania sp. NC0429]